MQMIMGDSKPEQELLERDGTLVHCLQCRSTERFIWYRAEIQIGLLI